MAKLNFILSFFLSTAFANVKAEDCTPLAGQYTIGKSEHADFASISDAVTALNCGGVSGPVTFLIENGTYNERVNVSSIPGASEFNTISIESQSGKNADVIISWSASDATWVLNNTSYFSLKNITISHQSAILGSSMRIGGTTDGLHFDGVIFNGVEVERNSINCSTVYFNSAGTKNNISFNGCEINNGSYGIWKAGMNKATPDKQLTINGSLFFSQYAGALQLNNQNDLILTSNVITALSDLDNYKGIAIENANNNIIISSNIITLAANATGISLADCRAGLKGAGVVDNNSITVRGNSETCGILLIGDCSNLDVNANTIKMRGGQSYYKNLAKGENINIGENMMYDLKTGQRFVTKDNSIDIINPIASPGSTRYTAFKR